MKREEMKKYLQANSHKSKLKMEDQNSMEKLLANQLNIPLMREREQKHKNRGQEP